MRKLAHYFQVSFRYELIVRCEMKNFPPLKTYFRHLMSSAVHYSIALSWIVGRSLRSILSSAHMVTYNLRPNQNARRESPNHPNKLNCLRM